MADMWAQMNRIIEVVHRFVPRSGTKSCCGSSSGQGPVAADSPADEFEDCDDAEDEYGLVEPAHADQDCWTQCARRD